MWGRNPKFSDYFIKGLSSRPPIWWNAIGPICFRNVVASPGPFDHQFNSAIGAGGGYYTADLFRRFVIKNLGLQYPVLRKHYVTIVQKKGRGRVWLNIDQVYKGLKSYFPDLEIDMILPNDLTSQQQVEQMAKSSVVLTPSGGGSFIATFVPPGASVVFGDCLGSEPFPNSQNYETLPTESKSRRFAREDSWWQKLTTLTRFHYTVCSSTGDGDPTIPTQTADFDIKPARMAFFLQLALRAAELKIPTIAPYKQPDSAPRVPLFEGCPCPPGLYRSPEECGAKKP